MAKLKKTTRSKTTGGHRAKSDSGKAGAADLQAKAEQMSRSLVESAQHIWMAGVGAFNRAQGEGSKLFEALVKEGMNIEQNTRKLATGKVDAVRDAMEGRVGVVRERASDTWDRLEKVFEERVQRALNRLGVPRREDLTDLSERIDALATQVKQSGSGKPVRKASKPAPGKTDGKAPVKARKATRKTLPKAPKPLAPQA